MKKLLILVLALSGVNFHWGDLIAQTRPFKADELVGDTDAAVGMSRNAFDTAKKAESEAAAAKAEVDRLRLERSGMVGAQQGLNGDVVRELRTANGRVLRQIAIIRKWEKKLPPGIAEQIKKQVDATVAAAITGDENVASYVEDISKALNMKVNAIDARVKALETDVTTAKADIVGLKKEVAEIKKVGVVPDGGNRGVSLAPEFLVVLNYNAANFLFGVRLILPAARSSWDVSLEAAAGVTQKRDFAWSVGIDTTKKLAPWVSLGPSVAVDALDNFNAPGVAALSATAGVRADFHVSVVDFTVGGGLGVHARDGDFGFGWRTIVGAGVRF